MKSVSKFFFILALIMVLSANSFAQNKANSISYTQHVQTIDPDRTKLKLLMKNHPELIIDHVNSLGYEVYGDDRLDEILNDYQIKFYVDRPSIDEQKVFESYPSPEQIQQKLVQLKNKFPNLIRLIEIGKSVKGRPLVFAFISSKPNESLPEFKYVANMHGDEILGRELMVKLVEDLASNYGTDQRITKLLDSVHVYIMPSMNPDGAAARVRFNANGIDLNRSFPDFTTSDNVNTETNRAPEVQAMMRFQAQHNFKLSANFHGGAEVVNYPWDTEAAPFPLDQAVREISLKYANKVEYMRNSSEFLGGIVNGYQWYEVDGGMQDWSYYWHKDVQVTIELSQLKWPDYSIVNSRYQANRDSLIGYIEDILRF
jgi:hypothetical protein